jgi:hypothetical protein
MTVSVKHACAPTPFDHAFTAALDCGWPGEAAFHACCAMRAHGMSDAEVEWAFIDAGRRVQ